VPIRTAPPAGLPATFSVALLGCAYECEERTTWDHILAHTVGQTSRKIDYMNWGGDWHYADEQYTDPALQRGLFETAWYRVVGLRDLMHRTPLVADQLSDHDGGEGGNNHDSFQNPGVDACRVAMSQMIATAMLQVPDCRFAVKLIGRVLNISLDTRSVYRSKFRRHDGPNKTLLGQPQLSALFSWLDWADDRRYLAVIHSDMVWDCNELLDKHDWWGTYGYERQLVADKIAGRRVIICDYDFHALRIKNASDWGGVPVIGSAGAIAKTNVRGDAESYYDQCWPIPGVTNLPTRHWHELVFIDDGKAITVDVTGYDPREDDPIVTRATFVFEAPMPV
jgi:hypothetical protein